MSSENIYNNPRPNTVDSLSHGAQQGHVNPGFHPDHLHTPPPKYEDVISGEYLKWPETRYLPPSPRTDQPTNVTCHCTNSQINTDWVSPSSESVTSSEESNKKCRVYFAWVSFVAFLLTIFTWTVLGRMGF